MASYSLDSTHYFPLLNIFLSLFWFFLWILWIFLLIRIISDVFRSSDLGGGAKAFWTVLLILLPFVGVIAYLITRGRGMERREQRQAAAADEAVRNYIQSAAGTSRSIADELERLAALRDRGILTQAEFEAQKQRLLASV